MERKVDKNNWSKILSVLGIITVSILGYEAVKYFSRDKDLDSIILIE